VFSPVTPGRICAEIVEQIKARIRDGRLVPGDRLPAERDLTAQLGVSRVSVRDALRMLEAYGLIEVRVGARGGAFVTAPAPELVGEGIANMVMLSALTPAEVSEARSAFELGILDIVCGRADDEDVAALEAICDQAEAQVESDEHDASPSAQFHIRLARATHNDAIAMLVEALYAPQLRQHGLGNAGAVERRKLVDAVRARDAKAARALMEEQLRV
jgi:DNA-binding FadR family transcriptional regulator